MKLDMRSSRFVGLAVFGLMTLASTALDAQPKVFTTGLLNPAKVILGPSGTLLVSEFGADNNSGRISIINASGVRRTLIDGLPSGTGANGPDGPTGMVLDDNTLYVAIGEGDQLQNGTAAGTAFPNQKGPASAILATILQLNLATSVDKITTGFSLKAADHTTLADGLTVSLDNGTDKATISMLSEFRYRPDAVAIYRNSHPYSLAKFPGDTNHLYLSDAGLNALVQVDLPSGRSRKFTTFPNQPNHGTLGGPTSESVPTSIRVYGGQFLVTLLTGFPFATGNSKIMAVNPTTGAPSVFLDNLTSTIDVASRSRFFNGVDYFVLEFSSDLLTSKPGRLRVLGSGGESVLADNLAGPSSMAYDTSANKIYITTKGDGSLLQVDVK